MTVPMTAPAIDPDCVPEMLCAGKLNVTVAAGYCTLTFTHTRPKAGPLLDSSIIDDESVVRARIVMPMQNMLALRDLLNQLLQNGPSAAPSTTSAGSSTLN